MYANLAERFAANVNVNESSGCFEWQGNLNNRGYARYTVRCGDKICKEYAHRKSYEMATGARIPEGLEIDHLCVNTKCIRPDHLEAVTREENLRRRDARHSH